MKTHCLVAFQILSTALCLVVFSITESWSISPRISAGVLHSAAIDVNGQLWTWGANTYGQLGYDTTVDDDGMFPDQSQIPQRVGTDTDWAAVSAGGNFTLAIKQDGTLYAWGENERGKLGVGDTTSRTVPTQIGTDMNWSAIAAGAVSSVALKTDGTLYTWGSNAHGQLGIGWLGGVRDQMDHPNPVQVGTDNDWRAISLSGYHVLAVKSDGSLWAWGDTSDGQAGLDPKDPAAATDGYVVEPRQVGSSAEWIAPAAGTFHSIIIHQDGTAHGWGANASGELGNGTADLGPHPTPTRSGTAAPWAQVAAAKDFTVAIKGDGTLWAWGENRAFQLGHDTGGVAQPTPQQLGGAANWVTVSGGFDHGLAMDRNGAIWAWGQNASGQLGNGTTTPAVIPTDIQWATTLGTDTTPPYLTANPAPGTYPAAVSVSLTARDDLAPNPLIYYTTSGADPDPTDDTQRYKGTITIATATTLKAISVDTAGNSSTVTTATYAIATDTGNGGGSNAGCFLTILRP